MATWNVTGLGDHISDIVEIMKKRKISVLGISNSRTKGSGSKHIDSKFVYTWSGGHTCMQIMESASKLTNNTVKL